jgi:lipoprotein-releasing system permease protein
LAQLGLTGWISLVGLILGVACLVVSMAVVSGFESTLRRSVSDATGHVQIMRALVGRSADNSLVDKVKAVEPDFVAATRVLWVESVAVAHGQITGALVQGLDPATVHDVLRLESHLREGELNLGEKDGVPSALVGKGLAEKFGLKVGETFRVVVPLMSELDPNSFRRNVGTFRVAGILDLGKFEFDERLVLTSLAAAQNVADVGDRDSGILVRLKDYEKARESATVIARQLGPSYRVRDWRELNENIFEAVKIERVVLFFVILIIVLAAAFNVSSSLFISVVQRYPEIGILKAMGMKPRDLVAIFSLQGLILGLLGCLGGFVLGGILCVGFWIGEKSFQLLPGSVYKLDHIDLVIRFWDVSAIFVVTLLICGLATLAPAFQGAKLTAVEGLRYE